MCCSLSIGIKSPKKFTEISQLCSIFSIVHCYHFLAQFNISKSAVFKTFVLKFTAYIMAVWSKIILKNLKYLVMFDNMYYILWISIKAL